MFWKSMVAVLLSCTIVAGSARAHEPQTSARLAQAEASTTVPLYNDLGNLTYSVTTSSPLAQRYFDQGLRLTYAFNHAEALRAFREAQRQDPNCAMCYWGEAFVLGPNINAPMDETAGNPAVVALAKAKTLAPRASEREQALIDALSKRYADDPKIERAALDRAYAEAMADATRRFPDDPEIAVLSIDAIMNLSPWDYWEADGKTPKGKIGDAMRTAERVLGQHPEHPGAIHLYIHLTEASAAPERAEPYANRLVEGRIALTQGDPTRAVKEFQVEVSIQDTLAYMEPPYWYYPVRQSLGAALLVAGKPAEAEQVFTQSLVQAPHNGWALYGLMQAQQAQNNEAAAKETEKRLQQSWAGDRAALTLKGL